MRIVATHFFLSLIIISATIIVGHILDLNAKETSIFEISQVILLLIGVVITAVNIKNGFKTDEYMGYRLIMFITSFVTIFILGRETSWGSSYAIIPDHISDIIEYIGLGAIITGTIISIYRLLSMKFLNKRLIKDILKTDMFQYGILFLFLGIIGAGFDKDIFNLGHDEMIEEIFELGGYCYYVMAVYSLCKNPAIFLKTV